MAAAMREVDLGSHKLAFHFAGPDSMHHVLVLPAHGEGPDHYRELTERLHNSGLQSIIPAATDTLSTDSILDALAQLRLTWLNLVGVGEGADLGWQLAATGMGYFNSLVVIDRCHPLVEGAPSTVDCGPIEVATTLVASRRLAHHLAQESGRHVFADFRLVRIDAPGDLAVNAPQQLATEIVLRTSSF